MKLSDELLQEFKERLIKFYSDESLFSMSASISVESKVNLFGQFMLEKQLDYACDCIHEIAENLFALAGRIK